MHLSIGIYENYIMKFDYYNIFCFFVFCFRLEILKVLNSLPIKNKTILQDSKVLYTVEKWSVTSKNDITSPIDSDNSNNSPNGDVTPQDTVLNKTVLKVEVHDVVKVELANLEMNKQTEIENKQEQMEISEFNEKTDTDEIKLEKDFDKNILENTEVAEEVTIDTIDKPEEEEKINEKDILSLATELLAKWLVLKEDFRIPKKERIKQMKEHEREADRDYKAGLGSELESKKKVSRYSWKSDRYRVIEKERRKSKDGPDHDKDRERNSRKGSRLDDRSKVPVPALTKYERRQLFAMQVAQEEEGRRRKQQEMWRQHEQRCIMMGQDPRMTGFDISSNFPCYPWNSNVPNNNWQSPNFPPNVPPNIPPNLQPNMPPNIPPNMPPPTLPPNMPPPNLPPNIPNLPPNMPPNIPPNLQPTLPPNIPPTVPPNHQQIFDVNCLQRPPMCQNPPPIQLMMPPAQTISSPCMKGNRPPLPQQYQSPQPHLKEEHAFVAPLPPPPPVKLPPKWKCAKDQYGRPYYYHIKIRISQWEPPEFPPPVEETQPECKSI